MAEKQNTPQPQNTTNIDTDVITKKLNDIFYKKKSLIELFYVEKQKGKCIISFI